MNVVFGKNAKGPHPGTLLKLVALLGILAILPTITGCSGESVNIAFTYPEQVGVDKSASYDRVVFQLSEMFGNNEVATNWNKFRTSWKEVTWDSDQTSLAPFPTIECPKDDNGWSGLIPSPGAPKELSPYLHVNAIDRQSSTTVLEGRFPIHVACGRSGFSIFLAPPWRLSKWQDNETNKQFKRIGHRITRIADGRYVITGGALGMGISEKGATITPMKSQANLLIYDPSDGKISSASHSSLARAFHSAVWNRGSILISGGLTGDAMAQKSFTLGFTGKTRAELTPEQLSALNCTEQTNQIELPGSKELICVVPFTLNDGADPKPFSLQQTMRVPQGEDSQNASTVQIGGIASENGPLQSMFHAATYLPGKNSILVTGGFYYNQDAGTFQAANFIYELSLSSLQPSAQVLAVKGMAARAGHTAIRIDDNNILLLGGVFGALGTSKSKDRFGGHSKADLLTYKNNEWTATTIDSIPPSIAQRAFHTARPLLKEIGANADQPMMVYISGGVAWPNSPQKGADVERKLTSYLLRITKAGDAQPTFEAIALKGTKNDQVHDASLITDTTLETGQLLYLGGARASYDPKSNTVNFEATVGSSFVFMPGRNADPAQFDKDTPKP